MNQNLTPSEIYHQVFKDVPGRPFSEIYHNIGFAGVNEEDKVDGGIKDIDGSITYWHPSIPQDQAVVIAGHDYQGFILRYPDNTYHHLDIGGFVIEEGINYYYPEAVDDDDELSLGLLRSILDDGLFWAYGYITDEKVQERIHSGEFNHIKDTLPEDPNYS